MENDSPPLKALLVAEGSGGHLIPALEVANRLAKTGARIRVWYAQRPPIERLTRALAQSAADASIDLDPIPMESSSNPLERLWRCGQLWRRAQRCFDTFSPDVVVGFGGWVSAPVVLAARKRRISCLLHEQNVVLGRANRWLARWVDRVAVSFRETQTALNGTAAVMTGLPIRGEIGRAATSADAQRFGCREGRPTLLVLGGSQGARAINRLMVDVTRHLSPEERQTWQVLHLTGAADEARVRETYAAQEMTAWVAPFLAEMDAAYAEADLVIARAGASTIAELARCGKPAILIPYPHAGGHQRANAQLVQRVGGGFMIEEPDATPERVLGTIRRLLTDASLRSTMGAHIQRLHCSDAAQRLTEAIIEVVREGRRGDHDA